MILTSKNNRPTQSDGVAIIGMAGRFPGADNIATFWDNLVHGRSGISEVTPKAAGLSSLPSQPNYVPKCAVVKNADHFDASFFGIYPKQAAELDPQHRQFLEMSWLAMEDAGYIPDRAPGRVGVFAGCHMNTYIFCRLAADAQLRASLADSFPGGSLTAEISNDKDYLATRVAYQLNLNGPSVAVQSACSTSLVAITQACESLVAGACDTALAGGVTITFPQQQGYLFTEDSILSPDGICRAFDEQAKGTVFGDGVGVVVLKRLEDALQDRDSIYAVIKGWGINNDGGGKPGYTAPSVDGQADAIARAHQRADISADSIDYVEAHGTGTQVGDPIEIEALTKAFRKTTNRTQFCKIASLKTNVGHLDVAAGVAGIIKTSLALRQRKIPKLLNFQSANPSIDFENSPFIINDKLSDWPQTQTPRRAGVSSFGVGGTNAHVVLEEAPQDSATASRRPFHCLPISARSSETTDSMAESLQQYVQAARPNLADAAYTLQQGRKAFSHRRVMVFGEAQYDEPLTTKTFRASATPLPLTFLFPGQGSQHVGMARQLYRTDQLFAHELDAAVAQVNTYLTQDLRALMFSDHARAADKLSETAFAQPALFVVSYALARWWQSLGVTPTRMIGHSVGEFAAAAIAGVMSVGEAARLVALRGQLMQRLPTGAMLAVRLGEEALREILPNQLDVAAANAPMLSVVSGPTQLIEAFQSRCESGEFGAEITCSLLRTSHAFHSRMMDPAVDAFREELDRVSLRAPQIPIHSTVTTTEIDGSIATSTDYWATQIREPVRFSATLEQALAAADGLLLEVGPNQALTSLARQHEVSPERVLASLPHVKQDSADVQHLMKTLGQLWCLGVDVDWSQLYRAEDRRRLHLPGYQFDRKSYWYSVTENTADEIGAEKPTSSAPPHAPQGDSREQPDELHRDRATAPSQLKSPTATDPALEQLVAEQTKLMHRQVAALIAEQQRGS